MNRFLCTVSIFYLCQTDATFFQRKRMRKGWIIKKTSIFLKKIVHFLHFETFYSVIIFMWCNSFWSHSVAFSFSTKPISVGISIPTPIPLFILVLVTFQLAYDRGKQRNLFSILFRKRDTCPTTSRLKWPIATMDTAYSSYSVLISL